MANLPAGVRPRGRARDRRSSRTRSNPRAVSWTTSSSRRAHACGAKQPLDGILRYDHPLAEPDGRYGQVIPSRSFIGLTRADSENPSEFRYVHGPATRIWLGHVALLPLRAGRGLSSPDLTS